MSGVPGTGRKARLASPNHFPRAGIGLRAHIQRGSSNMKAVVLPEYGDAHKLEVRDLPEPTPAANEIKVRVAAAGVNPIDWKLRSGAFKAYIPLTLPAVLGRDASGEIVALGPGVTGFKVGARVL